MTELDKFLTTTHSNKTGITTPGKVLIGLTGGIAIGLSIICAPFVAPAFRKFVLPYVPATNVQIKNILSVLPTESQKANKLLDIGSGDGRIVIAAAKHGIKSDGVELNSILVFYSRFSSIRNGVFKNTAFFRKDLWKFDTSQYKYVVLFGVEQMMKEVEAKLIKELKSDSIVIVCRFPFPNLKPSTILGEGVDKVWVYKL